MEPEFSITQLKFCNSSHLMDLLPMKPKSAMAFLSRTTARVPNMDPKSAPIGVKEETQTTCIHVALMNQHFERGNAGWGPSKPYSETQETGRFDWGTTAKDCKGMMNTELQVGPPGVGHDCPPF